MSETEKLAFQQWQELAFAEDDCGDEEHTEACSMDAELADADNLHVVLVGCYTPNAS